MEWQGNIKWAKSVYGIFIYAKTRRKSRMSPFPLLMRVIRYFLVCLFAIVFFLIGYSVGRSKIAWMFDKRYFNKIIHEGCFVDIDKSLYPDRILEDFYLTWKNKKGYAAFRETRRGFEGDFFVYWITDNGTLVGISEDNTTFFPVFHSATGDTLAIGYDDPNGVFVEIDPVEPKHRGLILKGREILEY